MEKVDIFKTLTKARSADFLGVEWGYISGVYKDSCYDLFNDDNCYLLNDEDEFSKIINKEFEEGEIYIALAYLYEGSSDDNENRYGVETSIGKFNITANEIVVDITSDYGIIVDKDLDYKYVHRCSGSFASGAFWVDLECEEKQLEKIIHDCIVFKE